MSRAAPFTMLDTGDATALAAYEHAFYAAFQRVPGNRLVRQLWQWDDAAGRVATRIPYADQRIYLRDVDGAIDGGLAVNVRMADFQSTAYGFAPAADRTGCCELLTFFSVVERRTAITLRFARACFADLHAQGFHTAYTTVAPRIYKTYQRLGVAMLDQADLSGERRYFLALDLTGTLAFQRTVRTAP